MSESPTPLEVCGLAGSLRRGSLNRRLLHAAAGLAPDDIVIRPTELLPEIPLFDEDLLEDPPDAVRALRAEVARADALLIATPEYNGGVPGVLKNALDWLTTPLGRSVLMHKPVAVIGASLGRLGTARSQFELRHTFMFSRSPVVPGPEVLVSYGEEQFDPSGRLTDEVAIERIGLLLTELRRYVHIHRPEEVLVP